MSSFYGWTLFLCLFVATITTDQKLNVPQSLTFHEKDLLYIGKALNFLEAFAYCKKLKMNLVTFTDSADFDVHILENQPSTIYWTAAYFISPKDQPSYWAFLSNGQSITGTDLDYKMVTIPDSDTRCAYRQEHNIIQGDCQEHLPFVCERRKFNSIEFCKLEQCFICSIYSLCKEGLIVAHFSLN